MKWKHAPVTARKLCSQDAGRSVQKKTTPFVRGLLVRHAFVLMPPFFASHELQDVLPAEKADRLLACLLRASRDWISRPWYNASGTPGMTHNRSFIYRIPTARDTSNNNSVNTTTTGISETDQDQIRPSPTQALDEAQRRAGSCPVASSDSVSDSGGGDECTQAMRRKSGGGADDVLQPSFEDESFDYGWTEAGEVGGGSADPRGGGAAMGWVEGAMPASAPASEAQDSAGKKTWIDDDQGAAVAPQELLEVVPLVVEAVRRYSRLAPLALQADVGM